MAASGINGSAHSLWRKIRAELERATATSEGFAFVSYSVTDPASVDHELSRVETALLKASADPLSASDALSPSYLTAYLDGLRQACSHLDSFLERNERDPASLALILGLKRLPYDARMEALQYVLDSQGDWTLVQSKVEESEHFLSATSGVLAEAHKPGNSPGIYLRHYLATLQEILRLISDASH